MNSTLKYFLLICFAGLLGYSGCEQVIQLDLTDSPTRIVIEGEVTTDPGPYRIFVRTTQAYYDKDSTPTVSGAIVVIRDDQDNVDFLDEVEPGIYETDSLQGVIGNTYTLEVSYEGEFYVASQTINRLDPIAGAIPTILNEPPFLDSGWYAILLVQDPPGLGDYYRLKVYLNDTLQDGLGDIFIQSDELSDGELVPFPYPEKLESGDKVKGELYSIGEDAFNYYDQLVNLIRTGGSPFGAPPDNVPTNISNNALGFFGAFAVVRDSVIIP